MIKTSKNLIEGNEKFEKKFDERLYGLAKEKIS